MVNDANYSFEETANAGAKFPLSEFFRDLSAGVGDHIHQVIATHAQQDAVAAFHVAVLCGVDVLKQMPDLIIDHLDQPGFYDFILRYSYQQSDQHPAAVPRWANVFAKAGLRSPAVARNLLESKPPESWSKPVTLLPGKRWLFDKEISASLYVNVWHMLSSNIRASSQGDRISRVRGFGGPISLPRSICRALAIAIGVSAFYSGITYGGMLLMLGHEQLSQNFAEKANLYGMELEASVALLSGSVIISALFAGYCTLMFLYLRKVQVNIVRRAVLNLRLRRTGFAILLKGLLKGGLVSYLCGRRFIEEARQVVNERHNRERALRP